MATEKFPSDTKMKKTLTVITILFFSLSMASGSVIINSEDWKDIAVGLNYAEIQDEDVYIVNNLGEANLVPAMANSNEEHTVLESLHHRTVADYETFLENRQFDNLETRTDFFWQDSSHEYVSELEDEINGFVVVNPDYTTDTLSVFPKLVRDDYWLLYYSEGNTEDVLNNYPEKDVIFYGEYLTQPWKKVQNNYTIINEGDQYANNRELVDLLMQDMEDSWMVGSGDDYLEKGFMTQGQPILILDSVDETIEIMERHEMDILEIVGPENANFGQDLRSASNEEIRVIVKTARTFTGDPQLSGQQLPMQTIEAQQLETEIEFSQAVWDEEKDEIRFTFRNTGNTVSELEFTAAEVRSIGGQEATIEPEVNNYRLAPLKSYDVTVDFDEAFEPYEMELLAFYDGERITDSGRTVFSIDEGVNEERSKNVSIQDVLYDKSADRIRVLVRNNADERVYVDGRLRNFSILGQDDRTIEGLESQSIAPGSAEYIDFKVHLNETQIMDNQDLDIELQAGNTRNRYFSTETHSQVHMEAIEGGLITGNFFRAAGGLGIAILILLLSAVLYTKREELQEKVEKYRNREDEENQGNQKYKFNK